MHFTVATLIHSNLGTLGDHWDPGITHSLSGTPLWDIPFNFLPLHGVHRVTTWNVMDSPLFCLAAERQSLIFTRFFIF